MWLSTNKKKTRYAKRKSQLTAMVQAGAQEVENTHVRRNRAQEIRAKTAQRNAGLNG
jgi:hypothetical protein